ncbi:MAG TPA: dephospho-CoA kinase [Chitinophagaceae bacterium]|jgi:dephospho-CoA kinase|nr:dephospho-CoA kinase [Chitinophagaceae bacterium]
MLKIGLTGGIGSGKTTVARIFELLGIPVYYADAASKRLYHTHAGLKQALKDRFGEDIYTEDQLDRGRLAALVFQNPSELEWLNGQVHPLTIRDAEEWMARQQTPYCIKEAALLFESGSAAGLDLVIGVRTPVHLRIRRVMERDGLSREEIQNRIRRQIDDDIKMRLCDYVVENNEQEPVIPQVLRLHEALLQRASG